MSREVKFGVGLLLGAIVGVSLVVLLAPQSGAETRQAIQDRIQEILDEGRHAAEARRVELTGRLEALKQPKTSVQEVK